MTQKRDEAIAKVYEELGPVKAEILWRYTGSDYDKPQSKRRIGQEMGLSKSNVVNGRFCPQSVRSFCPIVAGFNAGTYKVPACVL